MPEERPEIRTGRAESTERESPAERRTIGPYRLVERIGAGGMGEVFRVEGHGEAEGRQLALKWIHPRLAGPRAEARFRRERQILANLDHPSIARLIDGGTSDGGRPYLVLEYVDGLPLDRWCDRQHLPTRERVRLFTRVLDAVQHAHSRLVVHGDLKPSNILVDREGRPRLIDFGIAECLDLEKLADPGASAAGDPGLTPAYASPEQLRGEALTPASDVWSLCAILYELLTGRPPHAGAEAEPEAHARRTSRPPRPSTVARRAASGDPRSAAACAARETTPARLARLLAGELDAIVLKGLRPGPHGRQASAGALREDLTNWLAGIPSAAGGAGIGRRVAARVRRQRFAISATLILGAAFAGATQVTLAAAEAAQRAERVARERLAIARETTDRLTTAREGWREQRDEALAAERETNARLDELVAREALSTDARERAERALGQTLAFSLDLQREVLRTIEEQGLEPRSAKVMGALAAESLAILDELAATGEVEARQLTLWLAGTLDAARSIAFRAPPVETAAPELTRRARATFERNQALLPPRARAKIGAHLALWEAHLAVRDGQEGRARRALEDAWRALEAAGPPTGAWPAASLRGVRIDCALALAERASAEGRPVEAGEWLDRAGAALEAEGEHEPTAARRFALAAYHAARARMAAESGDFSAAAVAQARATETLAPLAAERARSGRASLEHLGARALLASYRLEGGDPTGALELLRADRPLWDELGRETSSPAALYRERIFRACLAQAASWTKDWATMREASTRRLEVTRALIAAEGGTTAERAHAAELALARLRIAQAELPLGRWIEATENVTEAQRGLEAVLEFAPDERAVRSGLCDALELRGDLFGLRASQATSLEDQARLLGRAIEALEAASAHYDSLVRGVGGAGRFARGRERVRTRLAFARGVLGQVAAARAAAGDTSEGEPR